MSNASNVLVSLCMIVKDEEDWLGRCLDSMSSIADEIIVVDTGSTDGTKAVGREHKAKVYDFEWTGSFSAARNFGLEKATGKWVMWLDADEELELEDAGTCKRILAESKSDLWMIPLINYYGEFPPDPNRAYLYAGARLFRNHKNYRFTGRIHEHLDVRQIPDYSAPKVMTGAKIHHYAYAGQRERVDRAGWCTATGEMVHGGRGRGAHDRHARLFYSVMPLSLRIESPSILIV